MTDHNPILNPENFEVLYIKTVTENMSLLQNRQLRPDLK
jgi:hypothetical protein